MSIKVKTIIVSLILVVVLAGIGIGLYCAWPAINGTINDSKYYTSDDMQNSYDKGYDDAFKNKEEMTEQIDYYKGLTDQYYVSIIAYQRQIKDYEGKIKTYENQNNVNQTTISNLEQSKQSLQSQVENLTSIKNDNEDTISSLNLQISSLQSQVALLTNSNENKDDEIAQLNVQISSLQNLINQLQVINDMNVNTITSLNSQISNLNNQISEMTEASQNVDFQIKFLNNKISELEKSITYYESYIAELEDSIQVVVTFEYDGSVYYIQLVNKGSNVSVVDPVNTDRIVFNGWKVDDEIIDLDTYTFDTSTTIVADLTYRSLVKFIVDYNDFDLQYIANGSYAELPVAPTKAGYEFDGWSRNGVDIIVDINNIEVNEDVTYYAVFTKIHTVSFLYEADTYSTQQVRNNNCVTLPVAPIKDGYKFVGWSVDGVNVVENIGSIQVVSDVVYIAIFDELYKFKVVEINSPVENFDYNCFWSDGENTYYSNNTDQYVLNKETSIWEEKTWNGVTSFLGSRVRVFGDYVFYAPGSGTRPYWLDKETSTWKGTGEVASCNYKTLWSDGENIYYTYDGKYTYKIYYWSAGDRWQGDRCDIGGLTYQYADRIWTDGENVYYSSGTSTSQYILNKTTWSWEQISWNGFSNIHGSYVWTDGDNIYYSQLDNQYVLNKETSTWEEKDWGDLTSFSTYHIWTDGVDYYCTSYAGSDVVYYKLVK